MRVLHECDIFYRLDLVRQSFKNPICNLKRIGERFGGAEFLTFGDGEPFFFHCIFKQVHPSILDLSSMVLRERP